MKFTTAGAGALIASSLLLAGSSSAIPLSSSENQPRAPTTLKLSRRAPSSRSGDKLLEWAGSHRARIQSKYALGKGKGNKTKRQTGEELINVDYDSTWVAEVDVGTPSQSYSVVLDTGSADFWLSDAVLSQEAASTTLTNSSTPFQLQYGSGQVAGYVVQDTTTLAGSTVSDYKFAVATAVSRSLLQTGIDGIMGLGFQKLSVVNNPTFWESANADTFSFYLERRTLDATGSGFSSSTADGGVFTLGGTNSSLYQGDISYVDLIESLYWMIPIGGLAAGSNSISVGSTNRAAIDTGTTLIGGPDDVVQNFYAAIDGAQAISGQEGYYSYPCSSSINAKITFGDKEYTIPDQDFNAGTVDRSGTQCMGAFFGAGSTATDDLQWIVGDAFLKNVYSVFTNVNNKAQVGFASLADGLNSGTTSTSVSNASTNSASASRFTLTSTSLTFSLTLAGALMSFSLF